MLEKSKADLHDLMRYLFAEENAPLPVAVEWSEEEDQRNIRDPRGFCHTERGKNVIYCSRALEDVDREVRLGILFHEIGHIFLQAFQGEESEVDVDTWVMGMVPRGSYHYMRSYQYFNSLAGETVEAYALQTVTNRFMGIMGQANER